MHWSYNKFIINYLKIKNFNDIHNAFSPFSYEGKIKKITFLIGENGTRKTLLIKSLFQIIKGGRNLINFNFVYEKFKIGTLDDGIIIDKTYKKELPTKNWFKFLREICED